MLSLLPPVPVGQPGSMSYVAPNGYSSWGMSVVRDKAGDRDQVLDELQKALQRLKMQGDTSETTPAGTPRSRAEDMEELARAGSDGRLESHSSSTPLTVQ